MFKKAGISLPVYNRFLEDLENTIPAMNTFGYYSKQKGVFVRYSDAEGQEKEWLDKYWCIEYNSLFDLKNLDQTIFPLKL